MKTKLEMAHDWAIKNMWKDEYKNLTCSELAAKSFDHANTMQAEADKREKEEQDKLKQNERNHHDELVSIGLEEWQPDWSQAPRCDVVSWDINEHGQARWIASDNGYYLAPSFGYTGDWSNSLRKRPQ